MKLASRPLAWLLPLSFALQASPASSQIRHGGAIIPDPAQAVQNALGTEHPLLRHVERYRGAAHQWTVNLPTRRGVCYEVLALARGESQVQLEIDAHRSHIGDRFPLANSGGTITRTRFCASLPGAAYTALLRSDGSAEWAIALHVAPTEEPTADPGAESRERLALALATANPSSPRDAGVSPDAATTAHEETIFPVGGTEPDYVGNQIRTAVQNRDPHAIAAAMRVTLTENQATEVSLPLISGHCILVVAAGVPSVSDLNLEIEDPAGNRVAQDSQHRGVESVSYCPPYSGTYRLTVRAFAGFGLTGIQAFEVH